MKKIFTALTPIFWLLAASAVHAASTTCPSELDCPFGETDSLLTFTEAIFKFGIALCVLAAAIYIAIGSFYYFAAAGNAKAAGTGKEIIQRSIIGLVLALVAWVILNTIHPQFAQNLRDPSLGGGQGQSQ